MLHRAFVARTYALQNDVIVTHQLKKRVMYTCGEQGDQSIQFSIEQVFENLEFDKLTNITFKDFNETEKSTYFSSLENTKLYISVFFSNIKDWSDYYIEKRVITEVIMFYPFLRISGVNNSVIVSFFFYFKYADGRKVLTVFEPVPDVENVETIISIQSEFINTFDTSVRASRFIVGDIFEYFHDQINEITEREHTTVITFNYILAEIVKQNFNIDITNLGKQSIIWTEGKLVSQMNKSDSEQIFVHDDYIYIAYDFDEIKYTEHLNRIMGEFFTIVHFFATYNVFKKLIRRSNLSKMDVERLKRVSISLDLLINRLKIGLSEGERNILKNNIPSLIRKLKLKKALDIINILLAIKGIFT